MDFNPLDEQSPLADYWQMNDGLDTEDAAVIASLATQALQAKLGYDYEDGMGVNEPAEVANYTESRSSPQSQYSAIAQEEPAESFRGLMEDHDRGAQFSEANVTNDYDMEPPTRGRVSDTVAGFEEQAALMRDSNLHDPIYSLLNVPAEMDETRGTMTASQVVNEVLRNNELAAQSQMDVNMQALHSQAAQLTPPDSESPSISAEETDHSEMEENFLADAHEQHDDCEPEDVVGEEPLPDTEVQQQLMAEFDERPTIGEDEMDEDESREPSPSPAPRKAGRPRKSDTAAELPDLVPEAELALREKVVVEEDEVTEEVVVEEVVVEEAVVEEEEEAVVDGAEVNKAEETPAARRRGRPRKSEIAELTTASSTKRGAGRPPKLAAPEATSESTPATGKRGRPRKSEVEDQSQIHPEESDIPVDEAPTATPAAGTRRRTRKSEMEDKPQAQMEEFDQPMDEAPVMTPAAGKRGRPRRSEVEDQPQILIEKSDIPLEEAIAAAVPGKRGRPRKSNVENNPQIHTKGSHIPLEEAVATSAGKRGRPRKSEVEDKPQVHTEESYTRAEATPAATPAAGKRGRPRKSEAENQSQAHTKVIDILAEETPAMRPATGKRGRPRKSGVEDKSQAHAEETDLPAEETPTTTSTAGRRGRPRRNTLVDAMQAPTDPSQPPVAETSASTPSLSKRGRPRKSEVVDTAHEPTDEHTSTATEATNSTPAPGRRGRPRKSEVMSTPRNLTDEHALSATETAVPTSTLAPAPGKRGRPRKSDAAQVPTTEPQPSIVEIETPTVTPTTGRRGRPRKSDAVSAIAPEAAAIPELQAEPEISTTADVVTSTTEIMERKKPFAQDEVLEEQHASPFIAPGQKRGRGRPPKSGVLNTATDPEIAANIEEAELQGSSTEHMEDLVEGMALDKNLGAKPVPDIWEIEVTPAKKRGRPKSSAMDKPLPLILAPVTASTKKRGRPPKASTTVESAETLAEPAPAEAEVTEERVAKRRRTDSDVVMEGSIDDLIADLLSDPMEEAVKEPLEEPQPEAREERPASVRKRRVSFAADTKAPKSLIPVKFMRRNSDSTGLKAGFFSANTPRVPRLGGPTDSSKENAGAEAPLKSTATQQTELFLSRLPRPTVESVSDGKKFGKRPRTYGKRLKK
ncbi:hypothetical protein TGAMA5MH_09078 [Trichoderma gamsii]|uniref:AT hook domain-containing protein n=1 Tax=Trichoderma gamsii TaxID=398673 RepID=A0A2K0SZZ9_9HYPO|nr:hypothetical protein TGAMA5MH_09078 [Trichoderma gamsii]